MQTLYDPDEVSFNPLMSGAVTDREQSLLRFTPKKAKGFNPLMSGAVTDSQ